MSSNAKTPKVSATTDYSQLSQASPSRLGGSREEGRDIIGLVMAWIYYWLRPIIKGFLRLTTRSVSSVCTT